MLVARDEAAAISYLDDGYYLVRALAPTVQRYLAGDLTGAERPASSTEAGGSLT